MDHAGVPAPSLTSPLVIRFLAVLVAALSMVVPAAAVDVGADDSTDEYLISGATVLDAQFPDAPEAIACTDCHWRVVVICTSGSLDDRRGCETLPDVCDARRAEVWRAIAPIAPAPGDPQWEYRGLSCLHDPPVSLSAVSTTIPELVRQAVPTLTAGSLPANVSLTNLPTSFYAGQPAAHALPTTKVAGARVTIHLQPTWRWDFGHGQPLLTNSPGRRARNSAVQHVFPRRGIYRVRVETTWHATYDVNNTSGFTVSDVITQATSFDLRVHEARRFLLNTGSSS